jgi:DNA polymerase III sliding clamp (beta) subunit (PCNA family)
VINSHIYTSDDFRLSKFILQEAFKKDFVLSLVNGNILTKLSFDKYRIKDEWIEFKSKDKFARMTLINEKYPDIKDDLFKYEDIVKVNRKSFLEAIERTALFAEGQSEIDYAIKIKFKNNMYFMRSQNTYGQNYEKGKCIGKVVKEILINPVYLIQILNMLKEDKIEIKMSDQKLIFEDGNFSHLIVTFKE